MPDDLSDERLAEIERYAEALARRPGWEATIAPTQLLALVREVELRREEERRGS